LRVIDRRARALARALVARAHRGDLVGIAASEQPRAPRGAGMAMITSASDCRIDQGSPRAALRRRSGRSKGSRRGGWWARFTASGLICPLRSHPCSGRNRLRNGKRSRSGGSISHATPWRAPLTRECSHISWGRVDPRIGKADLRQVVGSA